MAIYKSNHNHPLISMLPYGHNRNFDTRQFVKELTQSYMPGQQAEMLTNA